jgi:uncharacterized protein (TIGR00251 family)
MMSAAGTDFIQACSDGVLLHCWIQPRASKSRIAGIYDNRIKIAVAALPADGAANSELCKFLAKKLQVGATQITLIKGSSSRRKTVKVSGISVSNLCSLLAINPEPLP